MIDQQGSGRADVGTPPVLPAPDTDDGVQVDAVAAAVRGCSTVSGLSGGRFAAAVSYLPGRTVSGVQLDDDRVAVAVRTFWGVRPATAYEEIEHALRPLVGQRAIEVLIADVDAPATPTSPTPAATTPAPATSPSQIAARPAAQLPPATPAPALGAGRSVPATPDAPQPDRLESGLPPLTTDESSSS